MPSTLQSGISCSIGGGQGRAHGAAEQDEAGRRAGAVSRRPGRVGRHLRGALPMVRYLQRIIHSLAAPKVALLHAAQHSNLLGLRGATCRTFTHTAAAGRLCASSTLPPQCSSLRLTAVACCCAGSLFTTTSTRTCRRWARSPLPLAFWHEPHAVPNRIDLPAGGSHSSAPPRSTVGRSHI